MPPPAAPLPFGLAAIDAALPGGGLALAALHEVAGAGPDTEHGAAAALFLAGMLARLPGPVLWVHQQPDLFAPGLAGAGLHPDRLVFAEAGKDVLAAMEEGAAPSRPRRRGGGSRGRLSLVASRRLQLAAEQSGVLAVAAAPQPRLRRSGADAAEAAVTRWRIAALPSPRRLPHAPDPGPGAGALAAGSDRCRGGEAGILDRGGMRCDGSSRSGCRRCADGSARGNRDRADRAADAAAGHRAA